MQPEAGQRLRTYWLIGATLLSLVCYHFLIYQTDRNDFPSILVYFIILTVVYLLIIKVVNHQLIYWALAAAILLRLSILTAIPELSDDFYRFIWDGRLLTQGISPFHEIPSKLMQFPAFSEDPINQHLYQGMNSGDYFTVYPPLAQWMFYASVRLVPNNIVGSLVVMRLIIILFEIGSIMLLLRILVHAGLPKRNVLIYAWNPLVVVELTGNLHFEAIMIFFVLLAIYWLQPLRWQWSAFALAAGAAVKLVPLIFLPLLWGRLSWKKVFSYWVICGVVVVVFFLTIWSPELWEGMHSSLSLYFQKFEFNASIYYLVREIGFVTTGYNIIQTAGRYMALITLVLVLLLSWYSYQKLTWPQAMIWALTIYLLMATTIHPWYVTALVALAAITNYRFPIAWSVLVILSYAGYTETGYDENMLLVIVEYLLLASAMILDLRKHFK